MKVGSQRAHVYFITGTNCTSFFLTLICPVGEFSWSTQVVPVHFQIIKPTSPVPVLLIADILGIGNYTQLSKADIIRLNTATPHSYSFDLTALSELVIPDIPTVYISNTGYQSVIERLICRVLHLYFKKCRRQTRIFIVERNERIKCCHGYFPGKCVILKCEVGKGELSLEFHICEMGHSG